MEETEALEIVIWKRIRFVMIAVLLITAFLLFHLDILMTNGRIFGFFFGPNNVAQSI